MKTFTSNSLEETQEIASGWLDSICKKYHDPDEAIVAGLSGHLGAGKTAFVKCIARILGVEEEVTSPTFVIMKIYTLHSQRFHRLVHIDAYRLEQRQELEAIGFEKLVADKNNLIMIEWPENVSLKDADMQARLTFEIAEGNYKISFSS